MLRVFLTNERSFLKKERKKKIRKERKKKKREKEKKSGMDSEEYNPSVTPGFHTHVYTHMYLLHTHKIATYTQYIKKKLEHC